MIPLISAAKGRQKRPAFLRKQAFSLCFGQANLSGLPMEPDGAERKANQRYVRRGHRNMAEKAGTLCRELIVSIGFLLYTYYAIPKSVQEDAV